MTSMLLRNARARRLSEDSQKRKLWVDFGKASLFVTLTLLSELQTESAYGLGNSLAGQCKADAELGLSNSID